jgi:hypothetical protein
VNLDAGGETDHDVHRTRGRTVHYTSRTPRCEGKLDGANTLGFAEEGA